MDKAELIDWLRKEHANWRSFLDEIGPQRMELPGACGAWTAKDVVAHHTGWQRRLNASIAAAQRGEAEPPPPWPAHLQEEDEINAWIYESNRERSLQDILDEEERVFRELLAVVEALPDDVQIERDWRLVHLDGRRFPAGEFFDHFHDDHEAEMRDWLAGLEKQEARSAIEEMDLAAVLVSQFLASLEMLKQTIEHCPEHLWNAPADRNKFWQVAFHTLYFVHEYLADAGHAFRPWAKHRPGYEDFPRQDEEREPYDKATILEYLAFCQQHVAERLPQLKLDAMEAYGDDMLTMELQIYSIRHVMQHTGELMERLAAHTDAEIHWVGWKHD